jgi:aminoglycoside phosphotransferase (APT) family kinase protein
VPAFGHDYDRMRATGIGQQASRPGPPPARGVRLPWTAVPERLQHEVERLLGARVVAAASQAGGFSPGVAARLRLDSGERAFVKALGPAPSPGSREFHRREARIAAALPAAVPAPRLLAALDEDGWVLLLFEHIDGRLPAQPWVASELARVLDATAHLASVLTPSPIDAPGVGEFHRDLFQGWRRLASDPGDLAWLDPWARRHRANLAVLEADWEVAAQGRTLAHGDLRADNILLTADRVLFVDWPGACLAASWWDLVGMLPSVQMQGGPPPEDVFDRHPAARGADPDAVTAVVAAFAGYFLHSSAQPAPPGLPTLRAFQAAQGEAALAWLRVRTGWR